jgi:hypothetical protein
MADSPDTAGPNLDVAFDAVRSALLNHLDVMIEPLSLPHGFLRRIWRELLIEARLDQPSYRLAIWTCLDALDFVNARPPWHYDAANLRSASHIREFLSRLREWIANRTTAEWRFGFARVTGHAYVDSIKPQLEQMTQIVEALARKNVAQKSWLPQAMLLVRDHPDWPDSQIAEAVGVNKSTLSRNDQYQKAAQLTRGGGADRHRGYITSDRNGGRGLEAIDPHG